MKLKREENLIEGGFTYSHSSGFQKDFNSQRIDWLITEYLTKISTDESGWFILYVDPEDGRYWEFSYPTSEYHGGGAPQLKLLESDKIRAKYPEISI